MILLLGVLFLVTGLITYMRSVDYILAKTEKEFNRRLAEMEVRYQEKLHNELKDIANFIKVEFLK